MKDAKPEEGGQHPLDTQGFKRYKPSSISPTKAFIVHKVQKVYKVHRLSKDKKRLKLNLPNPISPQSVIKIT